MPRSQLCLLVAATAGLALSVSAVRMSADLTAAEQWQGYCPNGITCSKAPQEVFEDLCKHVVEGKNTVAELADYLQRKKCISCSTAQIQAKCEDVALDYAPKVPATKEQCVSSLVKGIAVHQKANPQYSSSYEKLCQDFQDFANSYGKGKFFHGARDVLAEAKGQLSAAWEAVNTAISEKNVEAVRSALAAVEAATPLQAEAKSAFNVDLSECLKDNNLVAVLCDAWMPVCHKDSRPTWSYEQLSCETVVYGATKAESAEED